MADNGYARYMRDHDIKAPDVEEWIGCEACDPDNVEAVQYLPGRLVPGFEDLGNHPIPLCEDCYLEWREE